METQLTEGKTYLCFFLLEYRYSPSQSYSLFFKTTFTISGIEEHTFCFSFHKFRLWFLLVFARFTCITTHPVQTSNWFGEQFATMRLWVLFPLTETTQTEKAKDCVTVWRVSIIKLNFLDNFWLDFLHQFRNWFFFANRSARRWFWASFIATRNLEAEIAEIFSFVSIFLVFELVSWNYQLSFTNQAVNWLFLLEGFRKLTIGFVPCIGKLNNRIFLRVQVVMFSLETHLLTCKTCVFIPRIKVSIDSFSLVTNSFEQVVS